MKGDFTRFTFRPEKHYTGVRMQQGRVQLDADWNEQADIQSYLAQTATAAFLGTSGAPKSGGGFAISATTTSSAPDLAVSTGRFFVNGQLCELTLADGSSSTAGTTYLTQPDFVGAPTLTGLGAGNYLAYLDVWTRHVTLLEDLTLREVALSGPDTATRLQTVWQVKLVSMTQLLGTDETYDLDAKYPASTLKLAAQVKNSEGLAMGGTMPPGSGYTRLDNLLYRIEIHQGGVIGTDTVTYKWSRDNGSGVAAWTAQTGNLLTIGYPGRDDDLGFAIGNWVEVTDDNRELRGEPGLLFLVTGVEGNVLTVNLNGATLSLADFSRNPKVRRWDMVSTTVPQLTRNTWTDVEEGIQIYFQADTSGTTSIRCKSGDYWVIPARAATRNVEWPQVSSAPARLLPLGTAHHYAPLAQFYFDGTSTITSLTDQRFIFPSLVDLRDVDPDAIAESIATHNHTGGSEGAQIPTGGIADSAISTAKIADSAVGTTQIADSAITTAKIAASAIDGSKINTSSNITASVLTTTGLTRLMTGTTPLYFTSALVGYPNSVTNTAEISNDATNLQALAIIGNRSAGRTSPGLGRRVRILDILDVTGSFSTTDVAAIGSTLTVSGANVYLDNATARGTRSTTLSSATRRALTHDSSDYLTLNNSGDYTSGIKLSGQTTLDGRTWLGTNHLYLGSGGDVSYGLGYFGSIRPFGGASVDGPALYGKSGGVLGTVSPAKPGVIGALSVTSGGYVTLPANNDDFSGGFTIETWVNAITHGTNYRIIDFGNAPGTGTTASDNITFGNSDTSSFMLKFQIFSGSTSVFSATGPGQTSGWMHAAVTIDTLGNLQMYVNGAAVTPIITGTVALPAKMLRSNCWINKSYSTGDTGFTGKIAHVRLWTRALTADEINDRYTNARSISTTGLVADWRMDDGTGTTATDRINARNGTVSGSASFETYQSAALTWDSSKNVTVGNNLTASGTVNFAGLTASKVVFTDSAKNLSSSGTVGVAQGGTGAATLTGVLKGNGTSAVTAMTGATGRGTRWSTDANTLGSGALYDDGTNVSVGAAVPSGAMLAVGTSSDFKVDASGNVTVGSSSTSKTLTLNGRSAAVAPAEALRVVRGTIRYALVSGTNTVNTSAVTSEGSGFTFIRLAAGFIDIIFNTGAFSSVPSVVVTPLYPNEFQSFDSSSLFGYEQGSNVLQSIAVITELGSNTSGNYKARVKTGNVSGTAGDLSFTFIAMGT